MLEKQIKGTAAMLETSLLGIELSMNENMAAGQVSEHPGFVLSRQLSQNFTSSPPTAPVVTVSAFVTDQHHYIVHIWNAYSFILPQSFYEMCLLYGIVWAHYRADLLYHKACFSLAPQAQAQV